jgi:hypothetical protein
MPVATKAIGSHSGQALVARHSAYTIAGVSATLRRALTVENVSPKLNATNK